VWARKHHHHLLLIVASKFGDPISSSETIENSVTVDRCLSDQTVLHNYQRRTAAAHGLWRHFLPLDYLDYLWYSFLI
jgi:hypothetical protein